MSTVCVPLDENQIRHLKRLLEEGVATNKADLMRKAFDKFVENQAVESVLKAMKEPSLEGDLDELAERF